MKDTDLRQKIIDALDWEPSVDAASIGVAVDAGVVTLTGHVPSYAQKAAAEAVVKQVKGVLGVAQEIEVRWPGSDAIGDDDIAKQALIALAYDVMLPPDAVQVRVSRGWVTLTGEVQWQYQRAAAADDIRKLRGVVGVTNSIAIKPAASVHDIEQRIKAALERDAVIDARNVEVTVEGDRVTLEGSVDSWRDRELVERTVWAAPGVRAVEDRLHIG